MMIILKGMHGLLFYSFKCQLFIALRQAIFKMMHMRNYIFNYKYIYIILILINHFLY